MCTTDSEENIHPAYLVDPDGKNVPLQGSLNETWIAEEGGEWYRYCTVGRDGGDADVRLMTPQDNVGLSRRHARMGWNGRQWAIAPLVGDPHSENNRHSNTKAGGAPLFVEVWRRLEDGVRLEFGSVPFQFHLGEPDEGENKESAGIQTRFGRRENLDFQLLGYEGRQLYEKLDGIWESFDELLSQKEGQRLDTFRGDFGPKIYELFNSTFEPSYLEIEICHPDVAVEAPLFLAYDEKTGRHIEKPDTSRISEREREQLLRRGAERGGSADAVLYHALGGELRGSFPALGCEGLLMGHVCMDALSGSTFSEPQRFLFDALFAFSRRMLERFFASFLAEQMQEAPLSGVDPLREAFERYGLPPGATIYALIEAVGQKRLLEFNERKELAILPHVCQVRERNLDNWENVARDIGVGIRTLFNYRTKVRELLGMPDGWL